MTALAIDSMQGLPCTNVPTAAPSSGTPDIAKVVCMAPSRVTSLIRGLIK